MRVSKWHRIDFFFFGKYEKDIEREIQFFRFTISCAGVALPSTCLCEYECAYVNEKRIAYSKRTSRCISICFLSRFQTLDTLPPLSLPFTLMFVVSLASNTSFLLPSGFAVHSQKYFFFSHLTQNHYDITTLKDHIQRRKPM